MYKQRSFLEASIKQTKKKKCSVSFKLPSVSEGIAVAPFNYFSFPPAAELSSQTIRLVSLELGAVPSHSMLNCTSLQISQSVLARMLSVSSLTAE